MSAIIGTTIPVLDANGYVALIETWGSDEAIIEAARMSSGKGFQGWGDATHDEKCPHEGDPLTKRCEECNRAPGDERLLAYLWRKRHTSPFEQAGLRVEVQAPILVFREWHRHRTQSFNEFSARYAQMPNAHYLPTLERLKLTSATNKQAQSEAQLGNDDELRDWMEGAAYLQERVYLHYERGLKLGVPREVARLNTPVSRYSRMVASATLLNWLRFLGLRAHEDAQWEIRQYANAVGEFVAEAFPRTWALFSVKPI